jgi:hypothetical protein
MEHDAFHRRARRLHTRKPVDLELASGQPRSLAHRAGTQHLLPRGTLPASQPVHQADKLVRGLTVQLPIPSPCRCHLDLDTMPGLIARVRQERIDDAHLTAPETSRCSPRSFRRASACCTNATTSRSSISSPWAACTVPSRMSMIVARSASDAFDGTSYFTRARAPRFETVRTRRAGDAPGTPSRCSSDPKLSSLRSSVSSPSDLRARHAFAKCSSAVPASIASLRCSRSRCASNAVRANSRALSTKFSELYSLGMCRRYRHRNRLRQPHTQRLMLMPIRHKPAPTRAILHPRYPDKPQPKEPAP